MCILIYENETPCYSPYYQIVCSRVFLPVNRVTSRDSASTAPKPIYAQVSLTCLCHYKIARHHMIPTIMATTNPRIPMIMSKSAPLVSAIFISNIVFLFKDHFLIVWSMNELSSADSLSDLVVLPEGENAAVARLVRKFLYIKVYIKVILKEVMRSPKTSWK